MHYQVIKTFRNRGSADIAMVRIKKDFHIPAHPGKVLQMILDEHNLSQSEFARRLGEKHAKINEICKGKRGVSAQMALKFAHFFSQSTDLWMGLQNEWELSEVDKSKLKNIQPLKHRA